jgi:ubiquinone/menaquinone biosynthesis C-methylase UbiE
VDESRSPRYSSVWNELAARDAMDAIVTGATPEVFERTGADDAALVIRHAKPGDRILDIGCGIGRVELYLVGQVGEVWGVDVSSRMIERARERLAGEPSVHFRLLKDREFLRQFAPESFGLVFSFLVLQHLEREDAFRYLQDSWRVLRPGGGLLVQFPNYLSADYSRAFLEGVQQNHRSAGRVRPYTEEEVRHSLQLLGFRLASLWFGGAQDVAEIYVHARKPD